MSIYDQLFGSYQEPPLTEAGQQLRDAVRELYDRIGNTPPLKIRFAGSTFEIFPSAKKRQIRDQLAALALLSHMQGQQTYKPGLVDRLAPVLAMYAGLRSRTTPNTQNNQGAGWLGAFRNWLSGFGSGEQTDVSTPTYTGEYTGWGEAGNTDWSDWYSSSL